MGSLPARLCSSIPVPRATQPGSVSRLSTFNLDERKTANDREREEQLITSIAKLVEARNRLTTELDQMRLR